MLPCHVVRKRAISLWMVLSFLLFSVCLPGNAQRHEKEAKKAAAAAPPAPAEAPKPDEPKKWDDALKGLKYRNIGPFRGGRSLTASGIAGDPNTYYFLSLIHI